MSVATRFARILAGAIDPEHYNAIRLAAERRTKDLHQCILEVAAETLDKAAFAKLKEEAEERESVAIKDAGAARDKVEAAKPTEPKPPDLSHAQVRIKERYSGLSVTKAELEQLAALIRAESPAAKLVKREAVISVTYDVQIQGKAVRVVWSPKMDKIVTAIPTKPHQKGSAGPWRRAEKNSARDWRRDVDE